MNPMAIHTSAKSSCRGLRLNDAIELHKRILAQLGKLFRNAKADHHVAHVKRDIDAVISRVRDNKSKASKRKPPS